ncbi:hypothetical protein H4R18_002836 [Coemansia javaensis]|uniref:RING-type domain-containing protein n=1 Tax=Coemansia javaensis TaxID=2761396 RepID=A0A9W8HGG8_9FUNG|nr:hypothetical protein H4R18_002836 [Coemansia javaensis]
MDRKRPAGEGEGEGDSEGGGPRRSERRRIQRVQLTGSHLDARAGPDAQPQPQPRRSSRRQRASRRASAEPPGEPPAATCPFCSKALAGTADEINAHANACLDGGGSSGRMETYVFDGEERVRVSALFSGSLAAQFGTTSIEAGDEDVDVDQQDETSYGPAQYSDADLAAHADAHAATSHLRTGADPQAEYAPAEAAAEDGGDGEARAPEPVPLSPGAASQLVVDALKARIREQDRAMQSACRCLVCQEPHRTPCVSIQCWHVLCEQCWLAALGTKKLCPSCQQITQPADLRRIYM